MNKLPPLRSRHNPRLKDYDYAQSGAFFITICTANRQCLFGNIVADMMQPNTYGRIVADTWLAIPQHFTGITVEDYVVMPNHFHGIVIFDDNAVGAASEPAQPPRLPTLPVVIGLFKSTATRLINLNRQTPGNNVWQRSYHDRLIRDEQEWIRIRQYIADNPLRWALDDENPDRLLTEGRS